MIWHISWLRQNREPALSVIDEKMPPELTITAVSLWLIVFLSLTSVVYLLVFMGKENRFGWPPRGIIWFTVAIVGFCAVVGFLAGSEQTARSSRESLQTLTAMNARGSSGGVATRVQQPVKREAESKKYLNTEDKMSLIMTKQEREAFLADVHIGIISIAEEGRGPLTVPIWYTCSISL